MNYHVTQQYIEGKLCRIIRRFSGEVRDNLSTCLHLFHALDEREVCHMYCVTRCYITGRKINYDVASYACLLAQNMTTFPLPCLFHALHGRKVYHMHYRVTILICYEFHIVTAAVNWCTINGYLLEPPWALFTPPCFLCWDSQQMQPSTATVMSQYPAKCLTICSSSEATWSPPRQQRLTNHKLYCGGHFQPMEDALNVSYSRF